MRSHALFFRLILAALFGVGVVEISTLN